MCRDIAWELFANESSALTNFSDLPSVNSDKQAMKGVKEAKKVRGKKVDRRLVSRAGIQKEYVQS